MSIIRHEIRQITHENRVQPIISQAVYRVRTLVIAHALGRAEKGAGLGERYVPR